jgi:hypothetical protein
LLLFLSDWGRAEAVQFTLKSGARATYNMNMERIVRNVRDIDAEDRPALEHVVGQALRDNQRLIIQVAEIDLGRDAGATDTRPPQTLADWTQVYEGLSDEEIATIDKIIKTRSKLTRNLP